MLAAQGVKSGHSHWLETTSSPRHGQLEKQGQGLRLSSESGGVTAVTHLTITSLKVN